MFPVRVRYVSHAKYGEIFDFAVWSYRGTWRLSEFTRTEQSEADSDEERYRSGHNEAVLKTVCPQGRVGSNPTLSVL